MKRKHIICYSGGHSSAIVAIEVARKYKDEEIVLLNHNINSKYEDLDIKRFKDEVAKYLGLSITYANYENMENPIDHLDLSIRQGGFGFHGNVLCTYKLKTEPFHKWLKENYNEGDIIYYGFDKNEMHRVQRRIGVLSKDGYKSDYPLALWEQRTIFETSEIGIRKPMQYCSFKHSNCIGCLKAGRQHWYVVYCKHRSIFEKAKNAEEIIGSQSIINGVYLDELEETFEKMKKIGVIPTEHIKPAQFWSDVKRALKGNYQRSMFGDDEIFKPCECSI